MLLAIDIGNSRTKLGWFDGDRLTAVERRATSGLPGLDDGLRGADQAVIGGVVPTAAAAWYDWLQPQLPVARIGLELTVPLATDYQPPEALGQDRQLGALAAWRRVGGAVLTADCGTATTLNAVSAEGRFAGGAILCGLRTQRDALHAAAALLPCVELEAPGGALGTTTIECLQAGLVLGHGGGIAWLVDRLRRELDAPDAPLIATGGNAAVLHTALPGLFAAVADDLVLHGLRLTWEYRS